MSDLTLSSIEEGLSDLKNLGKSEDTFEICGHKITIRTLGRPEEEAVQTKAGEYMNEDSATMLPWLNAQKYESLARAIVKIDDMDFRDVSTVTSTQDGEKKTVDKEYVILNLLNSWSTDVVDACWQKYQDLVEQSKEDTFDQVEFLDKEDLLKKHEDRVAELRNDLDKPSLVPEGEAESPETADSHEVDEEDMKDLVFNPENSEDMEVEFGEVEEAKQAEQEAVASGPQPQTPQGSQTPPQEEGIYDKDNPDRALTEEEKKRVQAEERAFQRRQQQSSDEASQTAQQLQQKRQRMNQQNPTVREGDVPTDDREEPTHLDDGEVPDEEDFVDAGTQHLGPDT